MGDGTPYFMCSDQNGCKLLMGTGSVMQLRMLFKRLNDR